MDILQWNILLQQWLVRALSRSAMTNAVFALGKVYTDSHFGEVGMRKEEYCTP